MDSVSPSCSFSANSSSAVSFLGKAGFVGDAAFTMQTATNGAAVKLLPQDARAYNRLGVVLYKAATRVEWQVFRDKPGLQMPLQRVPGDELTCWRSEWIEAFEASIDPEERKRKRERAGWKI